MNADEQEQTLRHEELRNVENAMVPFLSLKQHTPQHGDYLFISIFTQKVLSTKRFKDIINNDKENPQGILKGESMSKSRTLLWINDDELHI
jgi:hypothetical protein